MLKLGRALGGWSPGDGVSSQGADPVVLLGAAWGEIVGADVAEHSHPAQIVGDALLVTTRSSAWSQQLSYLTEQFLIAIHARLPKAGIERLRFRVGKLPARGKRPGPRQQPNAVAPRDRRPPAADAHEALARFREGVDEAERAKRALGWNECQGCTALIAPASGSLCVSCQIERDRERERLVSRLLFEAPWLGHAGTSKLVEDLSQTEYESIRRRLLARWWERLSRARLAGKLSRDGSERLIASSYVLLKSQLAPERLNPATVRNVLGDELHELLYGRSEQPDNVQ